MNSIVHYAKTILSSASIIFISVSLLFLFACQNNSDQKTEQNDNNLLAYFNFDKNIKNSANSPLTAIENGKLKFTDGINGKSLSLGSSDPGSFMSIDNNELSLDETKDFSIQFWMKSESDASKRSVILSSKNYPDNSLATQKKAGWSFYQSYGTMAWNIGSGSRRLTYERDNGDKMPLNDGKWHQLTMTYNSDLNEVRLYYDGINRTIYNVNDGEEFSFSSGGPLVLGWQGNENKNQQEIVEGISNGKTLVQNLVNEYNKLGIGNLANDDLVRLVVYGERFIKEKAEEKGMSVVFEKVLDTRKLLLPNPYTIYQSIDFMDVAPLMQIYSLNNGEVIIDKELALKYSKREILVDPEFSVDELKIWKDVLKPEEVKDSYKKNIDMPDESVTEKRSSIISGVWNIYHGGIHSNPDVHGWDSRLRVAEMLKTEGADVIMMQETYSNGDFIAAELGYYFATTVDWDYLNQGANISVLSRFPIKEIYVPDGSSFMNVGAKIAISETQDIYVMSNWYGMANFPMVYDFQKPRFLEPDNTPVLFGGDFNAVPHTEGGKSPASIQMLDAGFTDAFRSLHTDVETYPGYSHRSGRRIDQLYYKGAGLKNVSTKVVSDWPTGFPSDHFLIVSEFELK